MTMQETIQEGEEDKRDRKFNRQSAANFTMCNSSKCLEYNQNKIVEIFPNPIPFTKIVLHIQQWLLECSNVYKTNKRIKAQILQCTTVSYVLDTIQIRWYKHHQHTILITWMFKYIHIKLKNCKSYSL